MDRNLIIQIANFYKYQKWCGEVRTVDKEYFLRKYYKIEFTDHSDLRVGNDPSNDNSVWIWYNDMQGKKLESKAVLFQ